jgi:hypothetical protein
LLSWNIFLDHSFGIFRLIICKCNWSFKLYMIWESFDIKFELKNFPYVNHMLFWSWMSFKILGCDVFNGTTLGWVCLNPHHESHTIEHVHFLKIVQCCKHVNRSYGFLLSISCVFIWNCFQTNKYNASCCGDSNYWSIIIRMYSLLWCASTTLTTSIIEWSCWCWCSNQIPINFASCCSSILGTR